MDGLIALAYAKKLYNLAEGPQGPQGEPGSGAVGTVADAYSTSKTYAVGDYVIHDEEFYRCTTAITTAEAFNSAHWAKLVLTDEVSDLKSDLNGRQASTEEITFTTGGYIKTGNVTTVNLTPTADATARYAIVDCTAGDVFDVSCKSYSVARAWCFIDSNNSVLSASSTGEIAETVTAPSSSTKAIFNDDAISSGGVTKLIPAYQGLFADVKDLQDDTNELKAEAQNIETLIFPQSLFEQGTFGSSGSEVDSQYAIRIKEKIKTTRSVTLIPNSGYRVFVVKYDKDGIYDDQTGWVTTAQTIDANKQFRYAISHATPAELTDLTAYNEVQAINSSYDEYLMHKNMQASEDYSWEVRENLLKHSASIFGTESNSYGSIYYVDPNGSEHTTIASALAEWASDNYPNATIFIRNGQYNETVEVEGKTIRFIGESRDGTIIHTTTGDYVNPPINVRHGNVTIENMTLIADHSENPDFDYEAQPTLKAYGIHIDGGSVGGIVTVKNCTIMSFQAPAVGTGTIPNSKIRLIDCDCYCFTDYTADQSSAQYAKLALGCILWHTSNPTIYPTRGTEEFELINVRAYMENNYAVFKTDKSDVGDSMGVLSINTTLVSNRNPYNQNTVSGPVNPVSGSVGNNNSVLNYQS